MNQKGFTILELLIALLCIGLLLWFILSAFKTNTCEKYRYSSVTETPTSCVEYLTSD